VRPSPGLLNAADRRRVALTATLLAVLAVLGCGTSRGDDTNPLPRAAEKVTFEAADGVKLIGRLYGEGDVGVVLAHMGRPGDTLLDWAPISRELANRGYMALAFNRRGVCTTPRRECSTGFSDYASSWNDVVGAVNYIRTKGADDVALVGASIGAMASLHALARDRVEASAFVEIGGVNHASGYSFSRRDLQALEGQKLFVSSIGDLYGGADAAREWHRWAKEPKQLELLRGVEHGTDMLIAGKPTVRPLSELVLEFLARAAPPH
jgi:pimeloyl-ACP methyl ester carboxylesterase